MDSNETQTSALYDMLAWAQLHKKALLIGAGAVAVLVAVSIAYVVHATQKETAASKALSEISLSASPAGRADSGLAGRYLQVASDHPGTEGGARALLLAAATLYGDGKWTEAQAQYDRALREYGESQWAVQALYGRAACLDAGGNATEATAKYDEFIKRYATDPVADQARVSLARLYEKQNKPAEALKLFDDVLRTMAYTGLGSEAGLYRAELLEKHPELAPTNALPDMAQLTPPTLRTNPTASVMRFTNPPPMRLVKTTNADGTVVTNFVRRTNLVSNIITNTAALPAATAPSTALQPATPPPSPPAVPGTPTPGQP